MERISTAMMGVGTTLDSGERRERFAKCVLNQASVKEHSSRSDVSVITILRGLNALEQPAVPSGFRSGVKSKPSRLFQTDVRLHDSIATTLVYAPLVPSVESITAATSPFVAMIELRGRKGVRLIALDGAYLANSPRRSCVPFADLPSPCSGRFLRLLDLGYFGRVRVSPRASDCLGYVVAARRIPLASQKKYDKAVRTDWSRRAISTTAMAKVRSARCEIRGPNGELDHRTRERDDVTRMFNDPRAFKEEMIDGFVAAYGRYVRRVPGASGVVAVDAPTAGRVAVVIGGGSGHYPAFYGLVGHGLASAAAIGDVFTSPSGEQAYRVAKAADGGVGVLFSFGNYSGDVLNFGMAEARLRSEGIDARTVLVTDDVLSAPPAEAEKRRGIAGGFYVFKTAGASAARGDDLATVEALSRFANSRVRTVGVAFAGCTIPGQSEPLFTVDPGRMEVGLGIHGEPGVRTMDRLPAREIAKLLVDAILAAAPVGTGGRVAVLVNGLGATKYEELFVLYQAVAPLLHGNGIDVHETNIGEFVTSLDMAGCSLTLFWLDEELQVLHDATAVSPAYTRIGVNLGTIARTEPDPRSRTAASASSPTRSSVEGGRPGAAGVASRAAISAALRAVEEAEVELGHLDAAAGDGDHGAGMVRGFTAAVAAVDGFSGAAGQSLMRAGSGFMDAAGGASGALVGGWLIAMGSALPADDDAIDALSWANALAAGSTAIKRLGQAESGDKTMLDTLEPFSRSFADAVSGGADVAAAWSAALQAAEAGMRATMEMVSRRGRAARLGERSRGHQDAGATSIYYVLRAFGRVISGNSGV